MSKCFGSLAHWAIGSLGEAFGSLAHWAIGSLGVWLIGTFWLIGVALGAIGSLYHPAFLPLAIRFNIAIQPQTAEQDQAFFARVTRQRQTIRLQTFDEGDDE
jgi:hypothetical protein